jgi:trigger factor
MFAPLMLCILISSHAKLTRLLSKSKGVIELKTEVLSQEKNIISIKASFEAAEVDKEVSGAVKELSNKANLKGFRKGHVPRKTIELYFGKKAIYGEAMESMVSKAVENMVEEYELKLIDNPEIKPGDLKEGEPLDIEIKFEVTPEVTLPELETIEAEKIIFTPGEDIIQENIDRILEAHAELEPSYEERPLTGDDYVSIKYTGMTVGEKGETNVVEEEAKTELFLGQEGLIPEIKDALVGKSPSDKVSVELKADGSGKGAPSKMRYDIEVLGIMKQTTPELTDETVAAITNSKQKTVEEFKASVKENLEAAAKRESEGTLRNSAVEKLCEKSEVEIPETMIKRQKESMRAEQAARIQNESKMTMDEFFEKSGMDKDAFEDELTSAAHEIVKRSLVLGEIAEKEDIQWTPAELDAEIRRMAISSRIDPDKFKEYVYSSRERIYDIATSVRNKKAIDFIAEKVKVREVSAEEKKAEAAKVAAEAVKQAEEKKEEAKEEEK